MLRRPFRWAVAAETRAPRAGDNRDSRSGDPARAISLDDKIELMVPGDVEIGRSMRFLRKSHFSDRVLVCCLR